MKVKDLIKRLLPLEQEQEIFIFDTYLQEDGEIEAVYQNEDGSYYL